MRVAAILLLLLCSCDPPSQQFPQSFKVGQEAPSDSIRTTSDVQQLTMYNEAYEFQTRKFRRSDTLTSAQLILKKGPKTVFTKLIDANTFPSVARPAVLLDVRYKFVRTNRLYFEAELKSVSTGNEKKVAFAIFYQTPKLGQLDYWPKDGE